MYFSSRNLLEKWIKQYKLGCIRQITIWILVTLTSWKSESSNRSLFILDKFLFGFNWLLQEVCINCSGSTTLFLEGQRRLAKKERIQIKICVSVLKKGWVTLGPFHVLVFYKMDGRHRKGILIQIYVSVWQNGWVTLGPFHLLVLLFGFQ